MNSQKEAIEKLVNSGMSQKEATTLLSWYQVSGFLIPSNILSLILTLIGIELPTSIYFLIAILCMAFSPKYVLKNIDNVEKLKSRVKILKPICIIILVLWVVLVIANIALLF